MTQEGHEVIGHEELVEEDLEQARRPANPFGLPHQAQNRRCALRAVPHAARVERQVEVRSHRRPWRKAEDPRRFSTRLPVRPRTSHGISSRFV